MSNVPANLLYSKEHEWVLVEDGIARVGITDHAQAELGDITFVELPEDAVDVSLGDEAVNIESVKAAAPVYAPLSGSIVEINGELESAPESVNDDPYGAGWLFQIEISKTDEVEKLLTPAQYENFLDEVANDD